MSAVSNEALTDPRGTTVDRFFEDITAQAHHTTPSETLGASTTGVIGRPYQKQGPPKMQTDPEGSDKTGSGSPTEGETAVTCRGTHECCTKEACLDCAKSGKVQSAAGVVLFAGCCIAFKVGLGVGCG